MSSREQQSRAPPASLARILLNSTWELILIENYEQDCPGSHLREAEMLFVNVVCIYWNSIGKKIIFSSLLWHPQLTYNFVDMFSMASTPSAEPLRKAAKRQVVMAERGSSLAALDCYNSQKFLTQPALELTCSELCFLTVAPCGGLVLPGSLLPTQPFFHSPLQ